MSIEKHHRQIHAFFSVDCITALSCRDDRSGKTECFVDNEERDLEKIRSRHYPGVIMALSCKH
jgi:hypothetical protein